MYLNVGIALKSYAFSEVDTIASWCCTLGGTIFTLGAFSKNDLMLPSFLLLEKAKFILKYLKKDAKKNKKKKKMKNQFNHFHIIETVYA